MDGTPGTATEINNEWLARNLAPFGPTLPLRELIEELNRIYHAVEARDYDQNHAEIFAQLPPMWAEMIDLALAKLGQDELRVLDFGCGTGFETTQLLDCVAHERIAGLTCYDLSSEMLARCRATVAPRFPKAHFTNSWVDAPRGGGPNLVISNSVLHHLPELELTMGEVASIAAPQAVWITGHEPSSRYFLNPTCGAALVQFAKERRWRRLLNARSYWNRARRMVGLRTSPAATTAKKAYQAKLFAKEPSEALISRLVDFHVAHDPAEASAGRGLDFEELAGRLHGTWKLLHVRTYSFMGPFYEGRLPRKWKNVCAQLAQDYPQDGANFGAVWVKV